VESYQTQHQVLDGAVVDRSPLRRDSVGLLQRYFAPGNDTGAHFKSFRAYENALNHKRITSDDIVPVRMLSVDIAAEACLRLLDGQRDDIAELLFLRSIYGTARVGSSVAGQPRPGTGRARSVKSPHGSSSDDASK
jgi:hypothetical protein